MTIPDNKYNPDDHPEYFYDNYSHEHEYEEELEEPKEKGPLSHMPKLSEASFAFWGFILFVVFSFCYWQLPIKDLLWASNEKVFQSGEYWRLLTSLFVHADAVHLLSNTPLFLIFGWFLKAYFGKKIFPISTLFIGIISTAVTLYFYEPHIRLIGASGMLYGMVSLWLVLYIRFDIDHLIPQRIFRAFGFALIMLFPTTYKMTTSYLAHGAGFVIGLVCGLILLPFVKIKNLSVDKNSQNE